MTKIWVLTLFPEYFEAFTDAGVIGQTFSGKRSNSFTFETIQIRDYSPKNFKGVDDAPYGGGAGMVMRADVLEASLLEGVVKAGNYGADFRDKLHIIYPAPRGNTWNHSYAKDFALKNLTPQSKDLVFICGRYEGIDERFLDQYVDEYISLGDYILTGGELAVMTILDSSMRFAPEVLGNKLSAVHESFGDSKLEHPHYTRPSEFNGQKVPSVLLSGHHKKIEDFQNTESKRLTRKYRPDLIEGDNVST